MCFYEKNLPAMIITFLLVLLIFNLITMPLLVMAPYSDHSFMYFINLLILQIMQICPDVSLGGTSFSDWDLWILSLFFMRNSVLVSAQSTQNFDRFDQGKISLRPLVCFTSNLNKDNEIQSIF